MVLKQRSNLRIETDNMYTLPELRIPKITFHDRKYFMKRKMKRRLQKLNNTTSPRYRNLNSNNKIKNAVNSSLNSEFKMKRVKGAKSK